MHLLLITIIANVVSIKVAVLRYLEINTVELLNVLGIYLPSVLV